MSKIDAIFKAVFSFEDETDKRNQNLDEYYNSLLEKECLANHEINKKIKKVQSDITKQLGSSQNS